MSSIKSQIFIFLLKNRNLFKFQLKRKNDITWDTSIPELRKKTEKSGRMFGKLPANIELLPVTINNIYAEWILPPQAPKDKVILYFHGGGYVIGSPQSHRIHVSKVVKGSCIKALVFDYRLAPEHPFPAAIDDALSVFQWLLDLKFSPENIIFMGDSAGGGLCLATLLALRDKKKPLPKAAIALSPWTDLKNTGQSLTSNAKVDALTWKESWTIFSHYYVKDKDPEHPWISPLYGNLDNLCPLLIYVGEDELLRDDSIRFAQKVKDTGGDVKLVVKEGMFHCYPVCSPLFSEAKEAMENICSFIKNHLDMKNT